MGFQIDCTGHIMWRADMYAIPGKICNLISFVGSKNVHRTGVIIQVYRLFKHILQTDLEETGSLCKGCKFSSFFWNMMMWIWSVTNSPADFWVISWERFFTHLFWIMTHEENTFQTQQNKFVDWNNEIL